MGLIHPTAIVEDGARLGADVTVGAFSIVGRDVTLRDGVSLDAHVVVRGRTTVGERTRIAAMSVIGGEAQDLSYKGEDTSVEIGADCVIREHVTIHRGTARGRGVTTVGDRCFFMIGTHVAHDCIVGNNVILTNQALLGGHARIGDWVILGGLAAVQQRTRVGPHVFVAGLTGITRDVIPYAIAYGREGGLAGINVVGLKRRGFDKDAVKGLYRAYRRFFFMKGSRAERLASLEGEYGSVPGVALLIDFIRDAGNRPLAVPRRHVAGDDGSDDAK